MACQIVHSLPPDVWRAFVRDHPQGGVFQTPEMFEVYRSTKRYAPGLWAATDEGRVLALMMPVRIALMDGLGRHFTTRAIVSGGILCSETAEGRQALQELLHQYTRRERNLSLFTEVRNDCSTDGLGPVLVAAGFEYEDHLNYLIKLEACPENVFARIGPRTRKHIRQAVKRREVRVVEVTDRSQIPACYELLEHAYRNARVPLADMSLFYSTFDCLVPKGMARFTLAYVGDAPAAVSIDLLYKDVIYGWYGGMDRSFIAQVPNEVLMWNILEWGCRNNYRVYDFGGAGKPNEKYGVRDFKAKFGGELVCFGRHTWVPRPMRMTVSRLAYAALRRALYGNGGYDEKRRHPA